MLEQEVTQDPDDARIPWEQHGKPFYRRALGTLGSAFAPTESAPGIVSERAILPALGFALLFAFPLMAAAAVWPLTQLLEFRPGAVVVVREGADGARITLDVLRAAGIGLAFGLASLASWAVPFGSLLRAFCPQPELSVHAPRYAARVALYRAYLLPAAESVFYLGAWLAVDPSVEVLGLAQLVLKMLPTVLKLMHMVTLARALGLGAGPRLLVVLVPICVEWATALLLSEGMIALLPTPIAP